MRTNVEEGEPRADDGRADRGRQPVRARGGSADRSFPAGADPAATGAVRPGGSDLQDLQAAVFRLSPDLLADLPARLGMPEQRGAGPREVAQGIPAGQRARGRRDRADARSGSAAAAESSARTRRSSARTARSFRSIDQPAGRMPNALPPGNTRPRRERRRRRRARIPFETCPIRGVDVAVPEPVAAAERTGDAGRGHARAVGAGRPARAGLGLPLATGRCGRRDRREQRRWPLLGLSDADARRPRMPGPPTIPRPAPQRPRPPAPRPAAMRPHPRRPPNRAADLRQPVQRPGRQLVAPVIRSRCNPPSLEAPRGTRLVRGPRGARIAGRCAGRRSPDPTGCKDGAILSQ